MIHEKKGHYENEILYEKYIVKNKQALGLWKSLCQTHLINNCYPKMYENSEKSTIRKKQ